MAVAVETVAVSHHDELASLQFGAQEEIREKSTAKCSRSAIRTR